MKRTLTLLAVPIIAALGCASPAHASPEWSFGFGMGFGGGYFHGRFSERSFRSRSVPRFCAPPPCRPVHVHVRAPIYTSVWVPPVTRTVFVGYDHCGFPVYRSVVTCEGHYRTVLTGYHCSECGASCQ